MLVKIFYLSNIANTSRYKGRPAFQKPKYNVNEYIRSSKLLVVDEDGEQLGIMEKDKAIQLAKERELDLIEVSPNSDPPVARIFSWSKFKYQQDKKRKESKGKSIDQKEMWFKSFIEKGDLDHKLKKVRQFLDKKHPVKLTIKAKGRVSRDHIYSLMKDILAQLEGEIEYENSPKFSGRNMSLIVRPVKHSKNKNQEEEQNGKQE